ncbi:MAG: DUF4870 domain-containing protein [Cyanobacteriota bacterium]
MPPAMLTPQPVTEPTDEEKTLALIAQLAPLAGYLVGFGQIIIPLVILLVKGKESSFIKDHAQESLNFQISMFIYFIVAGVLGLILTFAVIGFILLPLAFLGLFIFGLVTMILASVKAYEGKLYRYPFCLRLVNLQ